MREKGARAGWALQKLGQTFDLIGQAQIGSFNVDHDEGRLWSHLRHNSGPLQVLKTEIVD